MNPENDAISKDENAELNLNDGKFYEKFFNKVALFFYFLSDSFFFC